MPRQNPLSTLAALAAVIVLIFGFTILRGRIANSFAAQSAPDTINEYERPEPHPYEKDAKPFFSLMTNHTYGTKDTARLWINYRGVDALDFRVYKMKDPAKFFRQLDDPHQVGKDEQDEVAESIKHPVTFLEKLRSFKRRYYNILKEYVRSQLKNGSRKNFNQRLRPDADEEVEDRTPLNVSDYARVPLLNPDQMVSSWREKLPPLEDQYDRKRISLGKREPGVYLVEAVNGDLRAFDVCIVTDLAVVQKTSKDGQMLFYAVDRTTGAPREGVQIQMVQAMNTIQTGTTDKQGLYKTKVEKKKKPAIEEADTAEVDATPDPNAVEPPTPAYLMMATNGDNFAISDLDTFYFEEDAGEGGGGEYEGDYGGGSSSDLKSYIYTDRPVYRPQQKVYFKGILRSVTENGYKLLPGKEVNVTVEDGEGAGIYEKTLPLSSRGTFSGDLDIGEDAPLGNYTIKATVDEAESSGSFSVEEYKKPEFKAAVNAAQKFVNAGEKTKITISANYFFGAPVAHGDVKYEIYRSRYFPWWQGTSDEDTEDVYGTGATPSEDESGYYGGSDDQMIQEGEGKLDAQGRLEVEFAVPQPDAKDTWDYTYRLEAHVTDPSRRTMDESASFTGVRGNIVASASPDRYVYYAGDAAKIAVTTKGREGAPVQTHVHLSFFERRWEKAIKKDEYGNEYPEYELKERELSSGEVDTNAQGEANFDYTIQQPGSIHIKTTVSENGRSVVNEAGSIWVADRTNRWSDYSYEGEETIKLVNDKKSYKPGETAHILALLPTEDAHLLVTTELKTVLSVREIDTTGRAAIIDVPIEARFAPNIYLNVTYVKKGEMFTQDQTIVVPARDKMLNLEIIPNKKEYKPRETASYTVLARNSDGSPASGAEVSLGVVDESIYSIQPETTTDIRKDFYSERYSEVTTSFSINYNFTGYAGTKSIQLAQNKKAYQLADFKSDDKLVNPLIRKIFKDTAFWQPSAITGGDGKATVKFELPDNLTTWRATARAITTDTRVGTATTKVLERKDVIMRIAMPRFLTEGDTLTLSGIVHNYLKQEKTTQISIDVSGVQLLDAAQQTVKIPSGGDYRVNWRVVAQHPGDMKILGKALTDTESDALEMSIPVVSRGLKQTNGEAASVSDDEADQTFTYNLPANANQYARGLRLEVSPSIAGSLFGALDYLTSFPYGCTEQTMSSFLPNIIVAQALQNVQTATLKDKDSLNSKVKKGLRRLYAYQHDDGGWGWWKDDKTDSFMSAYVVDGLTMAKRAGYEVDEDRLARGREKLKALIDSNKTEDGKDIDAESRAYMIYALNESGASDARYINDLFNNRGNLQPYGRALLALALKDRSDAKRAATVASEIERSAQADARGAHWASVHKTLYGTDYSNDVEATALSLKALSNITPQSETLSKAARWLVSTRRHGYYWNSTKETAFAIYGLTDYLKQSKELAPDYAVEVYINGEQVLAKQMTAADVSNPQPFVVSRKNSEVPNSTQVRVVKHGHGVAYLSTTLTHYTTGDVVASTSPQLRITRDYLRLRIDLDKDGQPAWKTEPLAGELHSGDMLVSRVHIEGERGQYLLIEDPIPSGCEQLAEVSGIDLSVTDKGWTDWYSSREFRDQRTAFFLNYFDGKATYQTAMRVQVPGQFIVAPARVEQMYQPSIQANTAGGALTILDNK
jgi:uncharacterized protein YfaS (alpha-2-macroglobulin family)